MSASPWPVNETASILFMLDAAHQVEQQHLERWLDRGREKVSYPTHDVRIVVPIADSPETIPTDSLKPVLKMAPDTLVIPVRVVWLKGLDVKSTTPRLRDLIFGNPRRPGPSKARRLLRKHPMRAQCVGAAPATLRDLSDRLRHRLGTDPGTDELAEFVAGQASIALDIAERRLRGSRYKVPRRVASNLLSNQNFIASMRELSEQTGRSMSDLHSEANGIFRELISVPRPFWLDISYLLNRFIASRGYDKKIVVDEKSLQRIRQIAKLHPTAILCTHKTHVDFPALNKVFFDHDFPALHTMGGVNMAFGGVGFLGRRAGVIFIRRSFQDDLLYKLILRHYIGYLLEKHFPLSWAFEGTRSRVGKLMPPKYGILKYVLEAAHTNDERNLHIIPVAINYDLINDVRDYAREQAGIKKRPESLSWFIGYLRSLRRPMGQIYMDFGTPVVLERAPSGEDRVTLSKIALQVGVAANQVTPITLASVATMILLGTAPRALTRAELTREIGRVILWAQARNIKITSHFELENEAELSALGDVLVGSRLVTRYDDGPETVYGITPKKEAMANYYRNTTIHHFVAKAIAELALYSAAHADQSRLQLFWDEVDRLRDLFKFEFFYTPTQEFHDEIRSELIRYDTDWERQLERNDDYGAQLLRDFRPLLAHATLTQFVEAYYVVADVIAMAPPGEEVTADECLKRCFGYGRQAYLRRQIRSQASIGKLLFQNGYKWMHNKELTTAGDAGLDQQRKQISQDLRELTHRLHKLQALALPA